MFSPETFLKRCSRLMKSGPSGRPISEATLSNLLFQEKGGINRVRNGRVSLRVYEKAVRALKDLEKRAAEAKESTHGEGCQRGRGETQG